MGTLQALAAAIFATVALFALAWWLAGIAANAIVRPMEPMIREIVAVLKALRKKSSHTETTCAVSNANI